MKEALPETRKHRFAMQESLFRIIGNSIFVSYNNTTG